MKKKRHKIFKTVILCITAYILITSIFLYLIPMDPQDPVAAETFYGQSTGVDQALLVEDPRDSFARRVEVIRSAREHLDVVYHCVKDGETTDCLFAEILAAADRGVKVRVMLDGAVGGLTGEHRNIDLALRSHPNIEYAEYNPVSLLKPWTWNVRLHDKFILADDQMMILGGRNIGDAYFEPPGYQDKVTHDRDVVILNPQHSTDSVTYQLKEYMEKLWNAPETRICKRIDEQKGLKEQERLKKISQKWQTEFPDFYLPQTPAQDLCVETRKVTLLTNPLNDFKTGPDIAVSVAGLLKQCENIRIQTPYATANKMILGTLSELAENGQVDYLTNSLASSPNYPAFSGYFSQRKKFVDTGIRIHEYQSRDSIHGKSCTADERFSVIGSFNLDDRSIYIDTESVVVIDSEPFTQLFNERLDELFAQSAQVTEQNCYSPDTATEILPVSAGKKILMGIASLFSRIFSFLV